MKKLAIVFPGQGTQYIGMGYDIYTKSEKAKSIYEAADVFLNDDFSRRIFWGSNEFLRNGENTQLAIFITTVAMYEAFKENFQELACEYFAGHSLGEYSALYAAGAFSFNQGLELVSKRAHYMQKASLKQGGGMISVRGGNVGEIFRMISSMEIKNLFAANINSQNQVVYSGTESALEELTTRVEELGDLRTIKLDVSGAFHSPIMNRAAKEMSYILSAFDMHMPTSKVISNVNSNAYATTTEIRNKLVEQIISPVQWVGTIENFLGRVDVILEIGPGRVLTGLNKKICKKNNVEIECLSIRSVETLNDALFQIVT